MLAIRTFALLMMLAVPVHAGSGGTQILACGDGLFGKIEITEISWTLMLMDGTPVLVFTPADGTFSLYLPTKETLTREQLTARYSKPCDVLRAAAATRK